MKSKLLPVCASFFSLVCLAASSFAAPNPLTPIDWQTPSSGTMGGLNVSLSGLPSEPSIGLPALENDGFVGAPYAAAPLGVAEAVRYASAASWTLSLSAPVSNLLLYAYDWRGNVTSNPDPTTNYTFSLPFTILSGFTGAIVVGNTLSLPDGAFYRGILQFNGPISSLSVLSDGSGSGQAVTFAANVPESASPLGMLSATFIGMILWQGYRRRQA